MNFAIFRRLLWKEYRQQRAFWVSMVFATLMLFGLFCFGFSSSTQTDKDFTFLGVVLVISACYALGCGATLFAGEHESGTFEFQRRLPLRVSAYCLSKVVFAVLSTAALPCVMAIPALLLDQYHGSKAFVEAPWYVWFLGSAYGLGLVLLWGMFFSLLLKRALLATFLAAVVGLVVYILGLACLREMFSELFAKAVVLFGIPVLLILANTWLGLRCFGARSSRVGRLTSRWGSCDSALAAYDSENMNEPRQSTILRRLVWQQWRFSRTLMIVIVLGFAVLLRLYAMFVPAVSGESIYQFAAWTFLHRVTGIFFFQDERFAAVPFLIFLSWFMITLFGSVVFLGDQRGHSVKFLAQRAARPWHVWFSRQIVWGSPFLLFAIGSFLLCVLNYVFTVYFTMTNGFPQQFFENTSWQQIVSWNLWRFWQDIVVRTTEWIGVVGLFFAAGQLCSMLLRSGLLAVVFGLVLSAFCAAWVALMIWLGTSPIWSVLPIAIGMFAATLLHAPDWMREHSGWRQYMRPAATAIVPVLVILIAIPFYRVYSIPAVQPGFDLAEYNRPETKAEKATAAMYCKATELMSPFPDINFSRTQLVLYLKGSEVGWLNKLTAEEITLLKTNEKAIELALAASQQDSCGNFITELGGFQLPTPIAYIIVVDGKRLMQEGKLDLAAERFSAALRIASHMRSGPCFRCSDFIEGWACDGLRYWAAAPGQTPKRIKAAIKEIDDCAKTGSSRVEDIKERHILIRSLILDEKNDFGFNRTDRIDGGEGIEALWILLPWEKARMLRKLNRVTAEDLDCFRNLDDPAAYDERMDPSLNALPTGFIKKPFFEGQKYFDRTNQFMANKYPFVFYELNSRTVRRATKIVLALEAWKLEHGELPKTLDQLVGPYFKTLPTPPRIGTVFAYFPKGLPKTLWAYPPQAGNYGLYERAAFGPNMPLLLVCNQQFEETGGQVEDWYNASRIPQAYRRSSSEEFLINDGFAFPIP